MPKISSNLKQFDADLLQEAYKSVSAGQATDLFIELVYSMAERMVKTKRFSGYPDHEDMIQNAVFTVWKNFSKWNPEKGHPGAYYSMIVARSFWLTQLPSIKWMDAVGGEKVFEWTEEEWRNNIAHQLEIEFERENG